MQARSHKAALFLLFTFSLTWLAFALGLGQIGVLCPMLVALFMAHRSGTASVWKQLGISLTFNRWYLISWLLPPSLSLLAFGVALLFPGVRLAPDGSGFFDMMGVAASGEQVQLLRERLASASSSVPLVGLLAIMLVVGLVEGGTREALLAFGEEVGWRGYLQRELSYLGFWKSSWAIGAIWGLWHLPFILWTGMNYPQHPEQGVLMMILVFALYGPVLAYVRMRARSVLPAAILHGSMNATIPLSLVFLKGGDDLTIGVFGLAGVIVLALANLGLYAYDRFGRYVLSATWVCAYHEQAGTCPSSREERPRTDSVDNKCYRRNCLPVSRQN